MLKIRLRRTGKRNQLSYRIVVAEARSKRDGQYLEGLGFWNPAENLIRINKKRYAFWLNQGAQPTKKARELHAKAS